MVLSHRDNAPEHKSLVSMAVVRDWLITLPITRSGPVRLSSIPEYEEAVNMYCNNDDVISDVYDILTYKIKASSLMASKQ